MCNTQDTAYDTPEHVMKGAQRMAAQLLAAEPGIRQFVRREFNETAVVNTGATLAVPSQTPDVSLFGETFCREIVTGAYRRQRVSTIQLSTSHLTPKLYVTKIQILS